jgi:predicted DNA-binding transcriptional regulator AlpA
VTLHDVCNVVQPARTFMPIVIHGISYQTASDVQRTLGVSRQTLWRWRQDGKVPAGRRYRDKQIVFSTEEVDQIRAHAERLEPVALGRVLIAGEGAE